MDKKIKKLINNKIYCPLCGKSENKVLTNKLRRGKGTVLFCRNCSHGYLAKEDNLDLNNYYKKKYRQEYSHKASKTSTSSREIFNIYKKFQTSRLDYILPFLKKNFSFLEVGASAGQFLYHIKEHVDFINAIEIDDDCFEFLKTFHKIDCDNNLLSNSKFVNNKYDIICAFQVMEHVEDPINFLIDLKNVAKKGSKIFIEVPNIKDPLLSVWDIEKYKSFFYHNAHIHYFSEASLKSVAIKAGFNEKNIDLKFTQDYNLLNHINWILNNSPQPDCNIGLSEIELKGNNLDINFWLSHELNKLNRKYNSKLEEHKSTSNIMMRINCE